MALTIIEALCGLALFLYGMKIMADGLEASAGSKFKQFLDTITKNRIVGVAAGALVTMVIQSSSATTVMVVGLVNAGLLELAQAVGVIMGANIGTTITGVIVSLNIGDIAPIFVVVGVLLIFAAKKNSLKFIGQVLAGLGILFLGMEMMGVLKEFSENEWVISVFENTSNPFLGLLVGLAFTALIQSSSATLGIIITLGSVGILDLHSAIFMLYGMNIGTCVTAMIASVGASKNAKRTAVIHLIFNVLGAAFFSVITVLPIGYADFISNMFENDTGKQLAAAHVIFNIFTTVLLFPLANQLVRIANKVIPVAEGEDIAHKKLVHLDQRVLNIPHIAVEQIHREVERMAKVSLENYKLSIDTFLNRNVHNIDMIKDNEETINFLNHEITRYLIRVSRLELEKKDSRLIGSLHHVINDIERVGDHAENIMEFSAAYIEDETMFSDAALNELSEMAKNVQKVLESAIEVFGGHVYKEEEINRIVDMEEAVDDEMQRYKDNHIERLNGGVCKPASGMLFINMLSDLERVADHSMNIALSLRFK